MKFNWGTGIAIIIVLFIIFMLTMLIRASKENIELVTEDYYPKELKYQEEIDAMRNAKGLREQVTVDQQENEIHVVFPKDWKRDSIKGKLLLYRPSDKTLDKEFSLQLDSLNRHKFVSKTLPSGKYVISVEWNYLGRDFLIKEDLVIFR